MAKDLTQQLSQSPSLLRKDRDYSQFIILAICLGLVVLLLVSIPTYTETQNFQIDGSGYYWTIYSTHHYIGDWHHTSYDSEEMTWHFSYYTYENTEFQIIVFAALLVSIAVLLTRVVLVKKRKGKRTRDEAKTTT